MAEPVIVTTTAVLIHRQDQNPWIDEGVIELRMTDEAGGAFFELRQENASPIRADLEDLEALVRAAKKLMRQRGVE